ncbi:MAG: hypothetical protein HRU02_00680 [Myxococcales bacterium]|nr:hypothetical protein [Myxococcales bacterium]
MPDLRLITPPPREPLLRGLRLRLRDVVPGWRPLAEGLLGAESRIDFVGLEPDGRVVIVLVGEAGEDLEMVSLGLAQAEWVKARLGDWLQLAPELPLRSEFGVRAQLLCPSFRPQARAAARALGSARIGLATYRWVENGSKLEPLVEILLDDEEASEVEQEPAVIRQDVPQEASSSRESQPDTPRDEALPSFRSKLADEDLGLTPEELAEFE